jgi:hypothetical protein
MKLISALLCALLATACAPSVTVDRAAVAGAQAQYAAADTATAAAVNADRIDAINQWANSPDDAR